MDHTEEGRYCEHILTASGGGLPRLFFSLACPCSSCLSGFSTKQRRISFVKNKHSHSTHLFLGWQFPKEWVVWGSEKPPQKGLEPLITLSLSPTGLLITLAAVFEQGLSPSPPWKTTVRLHVCQWYNKDVYGWDCVCLSPPGSIQPNGCTEIHLVGGTC